MLQVLVFIYVIISVLVGLYFTKNAKNQRDFAVASNSIRLPIATITVFATWFGAESILGIPSALANQGYIALAADPIGGAACLIFMGIFLAKKLYNLNVISIGDFFRNRFGKEVEVIISTAIALSYFGWIAAQFCALGSLATFHFV